MALFDLLQGILLQVTILWSSLLQEGNKGVVFKAKKTQTGYETAGLSFNSFNITQDNSKIHCTVQ